jgi:peptide/nickel transport system substrate-binding protein
MRSWDRAYALRGVGLWRCRVAGGMPNGEGLEVVDERTVRFTLPAPNPHWPKYWAFATNAIFDSQEARRNASDDDPWAVPFLAANPCGFGAFSVQSQDASELLFAPRADYWDGRPGVDNVAYRFAATRNDAIRMFESGEANVLSGLYPAEFNRVRGLPGVRSYVARTNHSTIEMDWESPPFDDQRVRTAVALAVPYDRIIEEAYLGLARRSRSPILDIANDYDEAGWPYDAGRERAAALIREAGAEGVAFDFYADPDAESQVIASLVAGALREVGLRPRVLNLAEAPAGMIAMWLKSECSHGVADAHYDIAHDYDPPRGMFGGRYVRDLEIVNDLKAINALGSSAEKGPGYKALAHKIVALAPSIFLANLTFLAVVREDLDPWVFGGKYQPWQNLLWACGRSVLPDA